jgi:hypothetical protein
MLYEGYMAKEEYKMRVREAELAYQRRVVSQPGRLSLVVKNLATLIARF